MPAIPVIDNIANPTPKEESLTQTHSTKFTVWGSEAKQ